MEPGLRDRLAEVATWEDLASLVGTLPETEFDLRTREQIHRTLVRLPGQPRCPIAFLGNVTLDTLARHTAALGTLRGLWVGSYVGGFGQHFQEVLDPHSGLAEFQPQVVFLCLSLAELAPQVSNSFLDLGAEQRQHERERILDEIGSWAEAARASTDATIVIANFPRPERPQAGIADLALDYGETEFYAELNLGLLRRFKEDRRVHVLDLDAVVSRVGSSRSQNPRLYYMAKIPWTDEFQGELASELLRYAAAAQGHTRKCLVLDLDNTLWSGVLGEEGVWGIQVGAGTPAGQAHAAFQRAARALRARGIVLAVASKNNPEDVEEVFQTRDDMPLAWDDLAVKAVNWDSKDANLRAIAETLNIGVDSLMFIDDNPAECELIRQILPEVRTVRFPEDPSQAARLLAELPDFEKLAVTAEDTAKLVQYQQNAERQQMLRKATDLTGYLESLQTRVTLWDAAEEHLPRVHQLFLKTNQFNLTTQRYSMADVEEFAGSGEYRLRVGGVADRFGDMGLVVVYLLRLAPPEAVLESFLMSCRAMGRGIETAVMNDLKTQLTGDGRIQTLRGRFLPTAKNKPVADYYERQGFTLESEGPDGERLYVLQLDQAEALPCPGITVEWPVSSHA